MWDMWNMCQMLNIWHISHTKHKNQLPSGVAYVPKLYHICPYCCKFATVWTNVVKPNNVLYLLLSLPSHFRSWLLISSLSLLMSDQSFPQQLNKHYLLFSLLSLPVLTLDFFSLSSHIRPKLPSTAQQRKNKMTLQSDPRRSKSSSWARPFNRIIATPIGSSPSSSPSEVQAAWARPLRSSPFRSDHRHRHCRRRRKWHGRGHSDHPHCHCRRHRHRHRRSDLADLSLFFGGGCFDCWWLGWWW